MRTEQLDYHLPPQLIATTPAQPRDAARLMLCDRATGNVSHHRVRDLPTLGLFQPGDLMVVNQTRVLPAYLDGVRSATGGRVTGLFLSVTVDHHWRVLLESRGRLTVGEPIDLLDTRSGRPCVRLTLRESLGRGAWVCEVMPVVGGDASSPTPDAAAAWLEMVGRTPLPPYIRKARRQRDEPEFSADDAERYNTVFAQRDDAAQHAGSVAAPTAGLHFTPALLAQLEAIGLQRAAVTLHVGQGTFLPVQADTLEDHPIHAEYVEVSPQTLAALNQARHNRGRILAVGTTTVRTLESLPPPEVPPPPQTSQGKANLFGFHGFHGETKLFITPDTGHAFRYTDRLLTNFHLPRSTLLALVAALPGVGLDRLMEWYALAIAERYRFYSFGDAMLIV